MLVIRRQESFREKEKSQRKRSAPPFKQQRFQPLKQKFRQNFLLLAPLRAASTDNNGIQMMICSCRKTMHITLAQMALPIVQRKN